MKESGTRGRWVAGGKSLLGDLAVGALVALVVLGAMQWIQRRGQRGGGGVLTVGAEAPAFELTDLRTSERLGLADLRGAPVILNFWATWCGPCVRELPDMEALHRESAGRYHVVSVVSEQPAVVRPVVARKHLTMPVLGDLSGRTFGAYRVERLPTTVILDREGRIVHDFTGAADPDILREHMARLATAP
ncbi:MAG: TlpA family protein disulfide reductase [Deltaproteobacteria bacterium]|nr:TlpA family protein disulfide reductase [Deltaproteobacteria bacterium]MCB9787266.1 TlpA family protein disulfide reductase [Deltaproteobacteria bacterium]